MSKKLRAAIIGPGNIGTDLLMKMQRSDWVEPVWMVGVDPQSAGLQRARDMGIKTSDTGVDGLLPFVKEDDIRIAFDATSAYAHAENSRKLNELGVIMIDLTPAAIGPFCIPPVNLKQHAETLEGTSIWLPAADKQPFLYCSDFACASGCLWRNHCHRIV